MTPAHNPLGSVSRLAAQQSASASSETVASEAHRSFIVSATVRRFAQMYFYARVAMEYRMGQVVGSPCVNDWFLLTSVTA